MNKRLELREAVINRKKEKVQRLLRDGAPVDFKEGWGGGTLLYTASRLGYIDIVRVLLENNAATDLKNLYGMTPLMIAACNDHEAVVRLLLDHGADREIHDNGYARDYAERNSTIVDLLDSYFPQESNALAQVLIGINRRPIRSDPIFDRNVFELVLCFLTGKQTNAFKLLQDQASENFKI